MTGTIKVGIIGANARGGWASESHVPATQGLDGLELVAIATNARETADEAAKKFGVPKAYASGRELIADPDIQLVTVATRVPDHRDLVLAAIAAGKHVYCEWPLGRGVGEAEGMAEAARAAGVRTAIGLQLRGSPAVRRARDLVASGRIGRVLTVSAFSSAAGFGPNVPAPGTYLEDPANFANLVTIQGGHTVDLAMAVVAGALRSFTTLTTRQYPTIEVGGEVRQRTTFDHLLLHGTFADGATLAIEVAGARPPETPAWAEIVGERGTLRLDGGGQRGVQSSELKLLLDGKAQPVKEQLFAGLPATAVNVAGVYAMLSDDILTGTGGATGFDHAVRLTQLVEDAFASSETGARKEARTWPQG